MCYRATTSAATGVSPDLLMAGRDIGTTLLMMEDKLQATPLDRQQIQQKDAQMKSVYQFFHDRHHSDSLPQIEVQEVAGQSETGWRKGVGNVP